MVMMIEVSTEKEIETETRWNPVAAVSAQHKADKVRDRRAGYSEAYERMKDWQSMAGFTIGVYSEAAQETVRVTMPEYLQMLERQAAELDAEVVRNGGQAAVEAMATFVPYAGELPPTPEPPREPIPWNLPA